MTECHSSSQRCDVQSAGTSRPRSPLESIHKWAKVRNKQARGMIADTLEKESIYMFFFVLL